MGRYRKIRLRQATKADCFYCEGTKLKYGEPCQGCEGTGKETVRKQLQKVYNAKNGLPIRDNLILE